ncbi:hypothetical protein Nepgr_007849 [Nepenthes gracilis]|uniref:Uncharacterized protein n=1 Tax=Nepenthes gracilis TaxID=150966 RepID=A0AAD3S808_NEPGR|nr:hypothetical protein Nepgr_007849 [Nepenthes gracilis]
MPIAVKHPEPALARKSTGMLHHQQNTFASVRPLQLQHHYMSHSTISKAVCCRHLHRCRIDLQPGSRAFQNRSRTLGTYMEDAAHNTNTICQ